LTKARVKGLLGEKGQSKELNSAPKSLDVCIWVQVIFRNTSRSFHFDAVWVPEYASLLHPPTLPPLHPSVLSADFLATVSRMQILALSNPCSTSNHAREILPAPVQVILVPFRRGEMYALLQDGIIR